MVFNHHSLPFRSKTPNCYSKRDPTIRVLSRMIYLIRDHQSISKMQVCHQVSKEPNMLQILKIENLQSLITTDTQTKSKTKQETLVKDSVFLISSRTKPWLSTVSKINTRLI